MTDLSPAAQAVAWAYDNTPEKETDNHRYHWLATALRAAADQMSSHHSKSFLYSIADVLKLQTIADELETQ